MTHEPLLTVRDLRIAFGRSPGVEVVHGLDLEVRAGEVVALVGESGSGKSVSALSLMGLLPEGGEATGSVRLADEEVLGSGAARLRQLRGGQIALISQDPIGSLNPVFTIGFQVVEAVRAHAPELSRRTARERAIELLALVDIPDPARRMTQYPHELSGGQCQRVGIAMALAHDPTLLIADEPTTALDVTVQAEVLDVIASLGRRERRGVLLITHDMGVVADIADRVVVMHRGAVVEQGSTARIFASAREQYTRDLLEAVPRLGRRGDSEPPAKAAEVLHVNGLTVEYGSRLRGHMRAVDDVSLSIRPGEIRGLVGESGSGKSTIGRAIIGTVPIASGTVQLDGRDLTRAMRRERRALLRRVGVVFQNPMQSLNPRYTVRQTVAEPLHQIAGMRGSELWAKVDDLLGAVGLEDRAGHYPHELSGGQRQRVAIARAVALDPLLLIADEPTSALDVSVQSRVLEIFRELQSRLGFACLFISHDLAVVDELCDTVTVLNRGVVVEHGTRHQVLSAPQHDYTRMLLASAPVPDPAEQRQRRAERLALAGRR